MASPTSAFRLVEAKARSAEKRKACASEEEYARAAKRGRTQGDFHLSSAPKAAPTVLDATTASTATEETATATATVDAAAAVVDYCTALAPHPLGQDDAGALLSQLIEGGELPLQAPAAVATQEEQEGAVAMEMDDALELEEGEDAGWSEVVLDVDVDAGAEAAKWDKVVIDVREETGTDAGWLEALGMEF